MQHLRNKQGALFSGQGTPVSPTEADIEMQRELRTPAQMGLSSGHPGTVWTPVPLSFPFSGRQHVSFAGELEVGRGSARFPVVPAWSRTVEWGPGYKAQ